MNSQDPTPSDTRPPTRFTPINVPRKTTTVQQVDPGQCRLEPPCQQGRHGVYFSPVASMNSASNRLGRYHITEEGLKHDLGALKRGEIYLKDDFLVRARAWYKAEIGRLTHREKVHEEWKLAEEARRKEEAKLDEPNHDSEPNDSHPDTPATNSDYDSDQDPHYIQAKQATLLPGETPATKPTRTRKPREKKPPTAPTRVQPSRSAKRKAPDPPPPPSTKRVKKPIPPPLAPTPNPPSPTLSSPLTPPPRTSSLSPPAEYKTLATDVQQPEPEPIPQTPPLISTTPSTPSPPRTPSPAVPKPPETKSDYTLPPYDWSAYKRAASLPSREPEAEANAFVARVEQAVGERVMALEILGREDKSRQWGGPGGGVGRGLGFLRDAELEGKTPVVKGRFEPAARREDRLAWAMAAVVWDEDGVDLEGIGDESDEGEEEGVEGGGSEVEVEVEGVGKVEGDVVEGKVVVIGEQAGEGGDGLEERKELKIDTAEGAGDDEEEEELTSALSDQFDDAMREIEEEERRSSDAQSKRAESEGTSVKVEDSLYGAETPGDQQPEEKVPFSPAETPFSFAGDEDDLQDSGFEENLDDLQRPSDQENEDSDPLEHPAETPGYDTDVPDSQANEDTDVEIILDGSIADSENPDKPKDESDIDLEEPPREPTRIPWDYSPTDSEADDSPDDEAIQASREQEFDWNPDHPDGDSEMEIEDLHSFNPRHADEDEEPDNNIDVPEPAGNVQPSDPPPPDPTPNKPPSPPQLFLIPGLHLLHPPTDPEPTALPSHTAEPTPPTTLSPPSTPPPPTRSPTPERNLSPSERNLLIERELFGYEGPDTDVHGFSDDDMDVDPLPSTSTSSSSPGKEEPDGQEEGSRRSNGPSPTTGPGTASPPASNEAVMDISPTLGKWIPRVSGEEGGERGVLSEAVEVSGLRFLVDVRDVEGGETERGYEVLILML
ncbi:hypothetical protein QBC39DRAFT_377713 [Podospora conica]|nr:hypothetical protein QBC39DRAFT_377713 [Schizothecium conicum]